MNVEGQQRVVLWSNLPILSNVVRIAPREEMWPPFGPLQRKTYAMPVVDESVVVQVSVSVEAGVARGRW